MGTQVSSQPKIEEVEQASGKGLTGKLIFKSKQTHLSNLR